MKAQRPSVYAGFRHASLLISLVLCSIALSAFASADAPQTVNLRGYGQVTAIFSPGEARFRCDSGQHADYLLGKLMADLFWDAGSARSTTSVKVGGVKVPVRGWAPYGFVAAVRTGSIVTVRGASTLDKLSTAINADPVFAVKGSFYAPVADYPRYLDFYDLRSFKSYTGDMKAASDIGLAEHWNFMKEFGISGPNVGGMDFQMENPAPNVFEWAPADYEARQAEREGGIFVGNPYLGGPIPLWAYNEHPFWRMEPSPTVQLGSWGQVGTAGGSYESWGTPLDVRENTCLAYAREVVKRYGANPALAGWLPCGGSPGAEYNFHDRTDEYWDYSPAGEKSFRNWLRTVKNYSLADLNHRWYGDSHRLSSWDDVQFPDVQGFFGNFDSSCLRLSQGWQWTPAQPSTTEPPAASDPAWVPIDMPPSQQQAYLPYGPSFFRISFDASDWLAKNSIRDQYLVLVLDTFASEPAQVWLNGSYLGNFKSRRFMYGPIGLKVNALLHPGQNDLELLVPGSTGHEGKINGPVFLSTTLPRSYPYLGPQRNAQFVDVHEWQAWGMTVQNDEMFRELRALDPNRPMILSGGGVDKIGDFAAEMARRYDLGIEMTGREAFYYPWNSGLGIVDGFYSTSEASATAMGQSLDRMMGWMMFDGDSSHCLYYRLDDYIKREKETGWFTQHKGLIRLFGKALRDKPDIVLLRSAVTGRLGDETPYDWDIGRGEIQTTNYDFAYATENEVAKGLVNGYPVLMDCGSTIMEPSTVDAIRRYVEQGGTFIAIHDSGRHTTIMPDSWPISSLTGFRVTASDASGSVTFEKSLRLMPALAGKTFVGTGHAVDWLKDDSSTGVGLKLQSIAPGTSALAHWDDGSTAVGCRTLGKGHVIVLGSTFWRDGKDVAGEWRTNSEIEHAVLTTLFESIGVRQNACSDRQNVWTRKFTTKNGLQDWVVAYNCMEALTTTEISYRTRSRPDQVFDMASEQPVPFTYANGWVRIPKVSIDAYQTRLFGSKREGLIGGLDVWWNEKVKYWPVRDADVMANYHPPMTGQSGETIPLANWRFLPDRDGSVSAMDAWRQPGFPDTGWSEAGTGPWNDINPRLKDFLGTGLYRARITIPAKWFNRRILFNLYSFDGPVAYDAASFWINGKLAAKYKKRFWSQTFNYDVTDLVHPGENVVAVQVDGGKEFAGLCGSAWLSPLRSLDPTVDLQGEWSTYDAAFKLAHKLNVPGRAVARYAARSFDVPGAWRNHNVYLRFKTADLWVGSIVINGRPIVYNSSMHPFGTISDVNLTPYVHFGTTNRLEIWPHWTASIPASSHAVTNLQLDQVLVGCEAK